MANCCSRCKPETPLEHGRGAMGEWICPKCNGRFLPPDETQRLLEKVGVSLQTLKELVGHFGGKRLGCSGCGQDMSAVQLRSVPVDLCTHCGGLWLDARELASLTKERGLESVVADPTARAVVRSRKNIGSRKVVRKPNGDVYIRAGWNAYKVLVHVLALVCGTTIVVLTLALEPFTRGTVVMLFFIALVALYAVAQRVVVVRHNGAEIRYQLGPFSYARRFGPGSTLHHDERFTGSFEDFTYCSRHVIDVQHAGGSTLLLHSEDAEEMMELGRVLEETTGWRFV